MAERTEHAGPWQVAGAAVSAVAITLFAVVANTRDPNPVLLWGLAIVVVIALLIVLAGAIPTWPFRKPPPKPPHFYSLDDL